MDSLTVKRKRGRPRKNPDQQIETATKKEPTRGRPRKKPDKQAEPSTKKKPTRGRPRKNPDHQAEPASKEKPTRGRPRKNPDQQAEPATKKKPTRGRPRKNPDHQTESASKEKTSRGRPKRQLTPDVSSAEAPKKRGRGPAKDKPTMDPEEYKIYGHLANDEKEYKVGDVESQNKLAAAVQKLEEILARRREAQAAEEESLVETHKQIVEKFREMIVFKTSGRKFGRLFRQIESQIFNYVEGFIIRCADGEDYNKKMHEYGRDRIYIINKTDETFGLNIAQLTFDNLEEYLGESAEREQSFARSSYKSTHTKGTVRKFLSEIKKRDDGEKLFDLLNLLSFEVSHERLSKEIILPNFVNSHSLISRIREKLGRLKADADDTLRKRIENIESGLPTTEKFLLLTMRGSFTDLHIDSSATAVFYHVLKGQKVIYAAEPSEENVQWYSAAEKSKFMERVWLCAQHLEQFHRFELNEGQTLMLPAGWLHFVFTPQDSIVVGGNFLEEDYLPLNIRMTKVEEECLKSGIDKSNLFPHFWETLYVFIEFLVNPELRQAVEEEREVSPKCLSLAKMLNEQLPNAYAGCSWMPKSQMRNHRSMMINYIDALEQRTNSQSTSETSEDDTDGMDTAETAECDVPNTNTETQGTAVPATDTPMPIVNPADVIMEEEQPTEVVEQLLPEATSSATEPHESNTPNSDKEGQCAPSTDIPTVATPTPLPKPDATVEKEPQAESVEHVLPEVATVVAEATIHVVSEPSTASGLIPEASENNDS